MSQAAVIQTAYLGDMVLTTPLIQSLAEKHDHPVIVVTTPQSAPLIETLQAVSDVIVFDKRGIHRGLRGIRHAATTLRRRHVEFVYLAHESIRSAVIAWLAGVPNRIGFASAPASWLYTERCAPSANVSHETDRLRALAQSTGPNHAPRIDLTPSDRETARATLREGGIEGDYVVLAPGAHWPTKRWPYFAGLAELLSHDRDVVFVGGPDEAHVASRAVPGEHVLLNLAGRLSIRETAAILETARLVVSNDSVAMHLAGAVRTSVIGIFGPTDPSLGFGPRGDSDVTVGLQNLPCRPCSTHGGKRCPLRHHRCMVDLEVDAVAQIIHNAWRAEAKR